jgi:hypothetical protein
MVAADTAVVGTVGDTVVEVVVGAAITGAVDTEAARAGLMAAKLTLAPLDFRIFCEFRSSPSMSCFKTRPAPI